MGYKPAFVKENEFIKNAVSTYNIENTNFTIIVKWKKTDINRFNDKLTSMYLKELLLIIHNMTTNRRDNVTIKYFQTKYKKRIPKQKLLTQDEVNSGLCYINSGDGDVNIEIYRVEEFYKVLTHEMLHLYNVIPNDPQLEKTFRIRYDQLEHINTNEALVELNAMILNTIIVHKLTGKNFNQLFDKEYQWSKNQQCKLLDFFDIENDNQINSKWKETTHAFSYYIIKTQLLNQILDNLHFKSTINKCKNNLSLRMTINDAKKYKLT